MLEKPGDGLHVRCRRCLHQCHGMISAMLVACLMAAGQDGFCGRKSHISERGRGGQVSRCFVVVAQHGHCVWMQPKNVAEGNAATGLNHLAALLAAYVDMYPSSRFDPGHGLFVLARSGDASFSVPGSKDTSGYATSSRSLPPAPLPFHHGASRQGLSQSVFTQNRAGSRCQTSSPGRRCEIAHLCSSATMSV
jgi:hypothetical protein